MGATRAKFKNKSLATVLLACAALVPTGAQAQEEVEPAESIEADASEERILNKVTVTARKREESLQETPIAVTVVGADALEERNVVSVAEIGNFAPNVQFDPVASESGGGASSQISIRGIGQTDWTITVEPGVGLYVDGVYVSKSVGSLIDAVDLESIQVLRGPQGALFGKNTIGGAVVVNSKRPSDEFEFKGELTGGEFNRFDAKAAVNIPLSDSARVRLSGAYQSRDGHVDRFLTGDTQGNKDALSGRIIGEFDLSPNLLATASLDFSRTREESPGQVLLDLNENAFFAGLHNTIAFPACDPSLPNNDGRFTNPDCANSQYVGDIDSLQSPNTGPNQSDTDVWGASFTLDYDGSLFDVKSITAFRDVEVDVAQDLIGTPSYSNTIGNQMTFEQFSQELQFSNTSFDGKLDTIVGLFYLTEEGNQVFPVLIAPVQFTSGGLIENDSYAIFGQSTLELTDRTSVTLGARYSVDERSFLPQQQIDNVPDIYEPFWAGFATATGNAFLVQEGLDIFPRVKVSTEDKEFTPSLTIDHKFTDDFFGYASYSRGFKGGGFTLRGFPPIVPGVNTTETDPNVLIPSFDPEIADVYEVGIKTNLFNNRARFNLATFYTDYQDIQLTANSGPSAFVPVLINAGDATIWGIEGELEAVLSDRVTVNGGFGYLDSEYESISPAAIAAGVTLQSEIPNSPEWTANFGISADLFETSFGALSGRLDLSYKGEQFKTVANDAILFQEDYTIVNASLTHRFADSPWALTAGVTNLTDEIYIISGVANGGLGYAQAAVNRPREAFIAIKYGY